jgi:glycerophosphoryl diester phosphodiesterase
MGLNAPAWLTARPIAHRGLHDARSGIVENTLGAAERAMAGKMAIECDVQLSADGEAMVFHDATLERLTFSSGSFSQKTKRELQDLALRASSERIPTFLELLHRVDGRTPVICELKSAFDGDLRLATRIAEIAATNAGPLALKSFDPSVIAYLRGAGRSQGPSPEAACPLGIVAEGHYDDDYWRMLSVQQKIGLASFLHYRDTRPDFLSYCVDDLPHAIPHLLRVLNQTPVMTWTVRTREQRALAAQWADQIIFEGEIEP